jgi:hypothetical protein
VAIIASAVGAFGIAQRQQVALAHAVQLHEIAHVALDERPRLDLRGVDFEIHGEGGQLALQGGEGLLHARGCGGPGIAVALRGAAPHRGFSERIVRMVHVSPVPEPP